MRHNHKKKVYDYTERDRDQDLINEIAGLRHDIKDLTEAISGFKARIEKLEADNEKLKTKN